MSSAPRNMNDASLSELLQVIRGTTEDNFRPRKKRPDGWFAEAVASGEIRDPKLGPNPPEEHPDAVVIEPPVMDLKQE